MSDCWAKLRAGNGVLVDSKVYCVDDEDTIHCYNLSLNNWTTLPLLPVGNFSLGQVNGKLVAVGGAYFVTALQKLSSDVIRVYNEHSQKWKQSIPPMPTARHFPGVLSLPSALIVAGGLFHPRTQSFLARIGSVYDFNLNIDLEYTGVVEIFKPDTSQWHKTDPLPTPCRNLSLTAIGNTCYALGGYKSGSYLDQALHASIDTLLRNAVPTDQTTTDDKARSQHLISPAWQPLTDTPTTASIAAVLGKNLIAITDKKEDIMIYVPSSKSWEYVGKLPPHRNSSIVVTNMSQTEILLFIGKAGYKGTLKIYGI